MTHGNTSSFKSGLKADNRAVKEADFDMQIAVGNIADSERMKLGRKIRKLFASKVMSEVDGDVIDVIFSFLAVDLSKVPSYSNLKEKILRKQAQDKWEEIPDLIKPYLKKEIQETVLNLSEIIKNGLRSKSKFIEKFKLVESKIQKEIENEVTVQQFDLLDEDEISIDEFSTSHYVEPPLPETYAQPIACSLIEKIIEEMQKIIKESNGKNKNIQKNLHESNLNNGTSKTYDLISKIENLSEYLSSKGSINGLSNSLREDLNFDSKSLEEIYKMEQEDWIPYIKSEILTFYVIWALSPLIAEHFRAHAPIKKNKVDEKKFESRFEDSVKDVSAKLFDQNSGSDPKLKRIIFESYKIAENISSKINDNDGEHFEILMKSYAEKSKKKLKDTFRRKLLKIIGESASSYSIRHEIEDLINAQFETMSKVNDSIPKQDRKVSFKKYIENALEQLKSVKGSSGVNLPMGKTNSTDDILNLKNKILSTLKKIEAWELNSTDLHIQEELNILGVILQVLTRLGKEIKVRSSLLKYLDGDRNASNAEDSGMSKMTVLVPMTNKAINSLIQADSGGDIFVRLPDFVDLSPGFIKVRSQVYDSCAAEAVTSVIEFLNKAKQSESTEIEGELSSSFLFRNGLFLQYAEGNDEAFEPEKYANQGISIYNAMRALIRFGIPKKGFYPPEEVAELLERARQETSSEKVAELLERARQETSSEKVAELLERAKRKALNENPSPRCFSGLRHYRDVRYFRLDKEAAEIADTHNKEKARKVLLAQIKALVAAGLPCFAAVKSYEQLKYITQENSVVKYPLDLSGESGHALVIAGYDDYRDTEVPDSKGGALLVLNSWNQDWGDGGFAWLPYEYVEKNSDTPLLTDCWTLLDWTWVKDTDFGIAPDGWRAQIGPKKWPR